MQKRNNKIVTSVILSEQIHSVLTKKLFAKSKYFYNAKKPPKKSTNISCINQLSRTKILWNYLYCTLILIAYFINIFKVTLKSNHQTLVLIYSLTKDQSIRNRSIKSLNAFLKSRGVVNNSKTIVLIEIRKILWNKNYEMTRTTIDIPLRIYADNFTMIKKINCWISMCKRFYKIMQLQRSNGSVSLILKEYIFDEIVYTTLSSINIKKLITTPSHIAYQPLIFEYKKIRAKKLMIWYSSNSVPIKYKKSNLERFTLNPAVYKDMQIDEHWVWTKKHKQFLTKHTDAKVLVKQSLMFYDFEEDRSSKKSYDVLIFDVTPHNDEKISNNSIFTSSEMIRFINESLECVVMLNKKYGVNYKVHLKHKRKITKDHSSHYSKFISEKISNKDISIVSPNQNLYDLISNSRLVIGFPFTSPVIIGQELNKPSVFYCSSKLLKPQYKDQNNLFLNTKDSLFSYMEKMLVKTK